MRIRRLVRTFAAMPLPAYNAGTIICRHLGYPTELAERVRALIVWRRQRIFDIN